MLWAQQNLLSVVYRVDVQRVDASPVNFLKLVIFAEIQTVG